MPKARTVSGVLLDKAYDKTFETLQDVLQNSSELGIISDGWTNIRGDHIVNFLVKAPGKPSMYYKSIDTSGIYQDAEAVAAAHTEVLEELGAEKFSSVVNDNAPVMKASQKIIESNLPGISTFGCAAHAMNLLVKNMLEPYSGGNISQFVLSTPSTKIYFFPVLAESGEVIKFVNNHHRVRALFNSARKGDDTVKKLHVAVPTRWFSQFASLKSVLDARYVLDRICDENTEMLKAISVRGPGVIKIIKNPLFWTKLIAIITLLEYPVKIIGKNKFSTLVFFLID